MNVTVFFPHERPLDQLLIRIFQGPVGIPYCLKISFSRLRACPCLETYRVKELRIINLVVNAYRIY